MRRYELSETQWQTIAPFVERPCRGRRGRPRRSTRDIFNGVLWVLLSGSPWRDLPERFGPWQTVYHYYRQWVRSGTFKHVLEMLHLRLDQEGKIDYRTWMVDATHVRAVRSSSGAGKRGARPSRSVTRLEGVKEG